MSDTIRGALAVPDPDYVNDLIEVREAFAVTDFQSAEWVIRKIQAARGYAESVQAWANRETAKAQKAEQFYFEAYGEQLKQLTADTTADCKKKYLDLPSGRLQLRKEPVKLAVTDDAALREWAKENAMPVFKVEVKINSELTRQTADKIMEFVSSLGLDVGLTETLSKTRLNVIFQATGEVPNGCEVVGGDDVLHVK
jgi:hypothetical protein